MDNENRKDRFKKKQDVENILHLLEEQVTPIEKKLTSKYNTSEYPTIFIFGCARSGTTVLHQYLIQNIKCIYPTNFISRFYYAPYVGGLYYKLFTDLDDRGELLGQSKQNGAPFFLSDLGKTKGIHSPNEFWYFWRKHFPINERATIDAQAIDTEHSHQFRNSIYGLQNLYQGPFIGKGMIANNCIYILQELFPDALFIFIQRDLHANAKSLYKARIDYFDTPKKWYSFYPKEKKAYQALSAEEQVVQQVLDTNNEIKQSLSECNSRRTITLQYESFCKNPQKVLALLKEADETIQVSNKPVPAKFTARGKKSMANKVDKNLQSIIDNLKT